MTPRTGNTSMPSAQISFTPMLQSRRKRSTRRSAQISTQRIAITVSMAVPRVKVPRGRGTILGVSCVAPGVDKDARPPTGGVRARDPLPAARRGSVQAAAELVAGHGSGIAGDAALLID